MQRVTSQTDAERITAGVGFMVMLFAAVTFWVSPFTGFFVRISNDLGREITPRFFAAGCIVGMGLMLYLLTLPRLSAMWQRALYFIATLPILTYAILAGWIALRMGSNGLSPMFLLLFYFLILALMLVTYRGTSDHDPITTN